MPFKIQVLFGSLALLISQQIGAFCGFYVAKADTKLFNKASKVVLVRDQNRTVLTMANDFQGEAKEFAIVIPVPTKLEREQIHVGNRAVLEHLDAYTAPRLVEYHDGDPCRRIVERKMIPLSRPRPHIAEAEKMANSLGITIEARYTVGEYDILILSAKESTGLTTWLKQNAYRLPIGAKKILGSYIKQGMRFFIAKVNLKEQSKLGFSYLRPLQIAFETAKFMLPIRLGTLNAQGDQELFVFALSRSGRVETTNYRTLKLPSNMNIPVYVKNEFAQFYQAMFTEQTKKENNRVVFLEYAWNMNGCDPCAAEPLSVTELRDLGVFWIDAQDKSTQADNSILPRRMPPRSMRHEVFVSRLHLRYNAQTFPEDLKFQVTSDSRNYQGRYVIRHPWQGPAQCDAAKQYYLSLSTRMEQEASTLASLTGWDITDIRNKINTGKVKLPQSNINARPWWKKLWQNDK